MGQSSFYSRGRGMDRELVNQHPHQVSPSAKKKFKNRAVGTSFPSPCDNSWDSPYGSSLKLNLNQMRELKPRLAGSQVQGVPCEYRLPEFKTFPVRYRHTELSEQPWPSLIIHALPLLSWVGESASSCVPHKAPSYSCLSMLQARQGGCLCVRSVHCSKTQEST